MLLGKCWPIGMLDITQNFNIPRSTILASAGNDGRVRLWKATARNVWRPAGSVGVEQAESEAPQTQTDSAGREGGLNGNGVDMDTA